jgi:type IV pilus assembly protein PilA
MTANLKSKYICYHFHENHRNDGFTLIELLVTIVIVGVLGALAMPSYLDQVAKARTSEAKSSIGAINRAQQSYRNENKTFASTITDLDLRINGKFYDYTIGSANPNSATVAATLQTPALNLKTYSGAVTQNSDFFGQVICESTFEGGAVPTPQAPTIAITRGTCANGNNID